MKKKLSGSIMQPVSDNSCHHFPLNDDQVYTYTSPRTGNSLPLQPVFVNAASKEEAEIQTQRALS